MTSFGGRLVASVKGRLGMEFKRAAWEYHLRLDDPQDLVRRFSCLGGEEHAKKEYHMS